MNLDLPQHIIASTQAVFDNMLMIPLTAGLPLSAKVYSFEKSISTMIGFSGAMQGMLTIHCPQEVAFAITGTLLGMEVDQVDADVKDTIGEMGNMILGGIKEGFLEHDIDIKLALPTVIAGRSYQLSCMEDALWTTVPFGINEGEFLVELKLKNPK